MARTTAAEIRLIIDTDSSNDLSQYISMATNLVDRIASADTDSELNSATLTDIETWIAAHYYSFLDPVYQKKKTGDAFGHFNERDYWAEAVKLDTTGYLGSLGTNRLSVKWLGRTEDEELEYWERN